MSTPPLLDIPDITGVLSSSLGALLVGGFFSVCLFGANSLQTWYYYQHYPTDAMIMKYTVACVWILEAAHAVFICHAIYSYVVLGFGNMSVLGSTAWSVNATIVVTALLTLIAHSFFAWRVYILSRKWFIPCLIAFLGTGHVATSWAVAGIAFGIDKYADISHSWENLTTGSLALGGATDLMIALSLGYHLHHARSGITKTDKLINKLIFWAVNIGILTSIADFTVVALISAQHAKSLAFVAVYEVVSNLYAASMLATLNIRQFTRDHVLDEHGTVIHLDSLPSHVKIKKLLLISSNPYSRSPLFPMPISRDAHGEPRCTIPSASLSNENIGIPSETKESLHNSLSGKEVFHC